MCYFLADFNRKINLSHITNATTPFGTMREGIRRTRDALTDLSKRGGKKREGSYLVNKSGKLSQYTTDNLKHAVNPIKLLKKPTAKAGDNVSAILHNHPSGVALSPGDYASTNTQRQIFNSTPGGSVYRGYRKLPIDKSTLTNVYEDTKKMVHDEYKKLKPGVLTDKDISRRGFLHTHISNKLLHKSGVIHYRAKLSPKDQRTLDFWLERSPKLRERYEQQLTLSDIFNR